MVKNCTNGAYNQCGVAITQQGFERLVTVAQMTNKKRLISAKTVGFLKLDTRFPRIVGDAGCAETWQFPVLYHTVVGGSPVCVVRRRAENLLPAFIAGGQLLWEQGVAGIATTCGFLCLHQQALAAALPLPVMTSALLMASAVPLPPGKRLGILTASAQDLTEAHLLAAGIHPASVAVGGLAPESSFAQTLLLNLPTLDVEQAKRDMIAAARALCANADDVGALLLECTNMPPYAAALRRETGLPVYSIIDAVNNFHRRLSGEETRH